MNKITKTLASCVADSFELDFGQLQLDALN